MMAYARMNACMGVLSDTIITRNVLEKLIANLEVIMTEEYVIG